jgi:hypothetical protein
MVDKNVNWQTCYRLEAGPKSVWCENLTNLGGTEFPLNIPDKETAIQATVSYFDDERVIESEGELSDCLAKLASTLTLSSRFAEILRELALHEDIETRSTIILNTRGDKLAEWTTFFSQQTPNHDTYGVRAWEHRICVC